MSKAWRGLLPSRSHSRHFSSLGQPYNTRTGVQLLPSRSHSRHFSLVLLALVVLSLLTPAALACSSPAQNSPPSPANPEVILATTTSVRDSGLLDVLLPEFEKKTGYKVKPIAVGTGAALAYGERGEADVLLVHAPALERQFMQGGHGEDRRLLMHNDMLIAGPPSDRAGIGGTRLASEAFRKIVAAGAVFISRGDKSGTHLMELDIWKAAGVDPTGKPWYQASGQGMGETLRIAWEKEGYVLTDRATYLALGKTLGLEVLVEGDPILLNIYHVIQVNPAKSDRINAQGAAAFVEFMVAPETQQIIGAYTNKDGQRLFQPDAATTDEVLRNS